MKDVNSHNPREEHVVKEELCSVHEVVVLANLLHRDENLLHSKSRLSLAYTGSFRIACCQKRQQWLEFRLFIYVYLSLNPPQTSQHILQQRFFVITWHLLLAEFHVWHGLTFNTGARGWKKALAPKLRLSVQVGVVHFAPRALPTTLHRRIKLIFAPGRL